MRVALVAPFGLRAKGTARARALPLGRALAARGHTVSLFVPPYDGPVDSGRCWSDGGVTVVNVALPGDRPARRPALPAQSGSPSGSPFWHLLLAWRLLATVRSWHPDVIHIFKPKGPSGLVGTGLWLARRLPLFGSGRRPALVVDSDDWEGPGGWNDDPRAGYSPLQRRFFAWQERYGLSHAGAWTVASHCLSQRAAAFGAPPDRIFLLPNGLADDWVAPSSVPGQVAGHEDRAATALLYTRFAGVRVADVTAVWRRIVAARPAARLTVVGRGLAGEEAELAGRAPNVDVAGWVDPADTPALFARMDVALAPWADTPSNRARHSAKILELMAAAVPVVAYAVGELPSTLAEGGVLVAPGDEVAFAAAVVALLDDPARAARLGMAARARVRDAYSWNRLANTALAAYVRAGEDGSLGKTLAK